MRLNNCIMGLSVATMLLDVGLSPWMFGSVQLWAQLICLAGAILAASLAVFLPAWSKLPTAAWGLMGIVVLVLLQLVRLSPEVMTVLSPVSLELSNFFGVVPSSFSTISLEPAATRSHLSTLIGVVLIYFAASRCVEKWMFPWILVALTLNGVALSLLGIWQQQFSGNKIYGFIAPFAAAPFGPFVCKNNAAGFLLSSLGAALGLVLTTLAARSQTEGESYLQSSPIRALFRSKLALFGIVSGIVIICGILSSMSRGGSVALFAGVLSTSILVLRRKHVGSALVMLVVISIGSISLLVMAGDFVPVSNRVALAFDESRLAIDGRISIWRDCATIFRDFWMTGTGLGTFQGVFRVYDSNPDGIIASHAENFLVQLGCEGGLPILLLSLFVYIFQFRAAVNLLLKKRAYETAIGTTWVFVLTTQFIASCFDFGLYIPAVIYQLTFVVGLCSSVAAKSDSIEERLEIDMRIAKHPPQWLNSVLQACGRRFEFLLLGVLFLGFFGAVDLTRAASLETLPVGSIQENAWFADGQGDSTQQDRLLRNIASRTDDSKAHFAIAEWYIQQFENELSSKLPSGSKLQLSSFASRMEQQKGAVSPEQLKLLESDLIRNNLVPASDHLHASRKANLFDPNVHLRLFHLGFLSPEEDASKDLERTIRLLEGKRYDQFVEGLSNYKNGKFAQAFACWRPCLEMKSKYRTQIVLYAMQVETVDQLLVELFPKKKWFLLELANQHLTDPNQQDLRLRVLEMARDTKG